jgi:hypothetical protein
MLLHADDPDRLFRSIPDLIGTTMLIPRAIPRVALIVVCMFNALSAVVGGVGLLVPGSMGIPLSMIQGSPFNSFLWPALVLLVIVGGSQVLALVEVLRRRESALFWPSVAGFGMLIWIFVEVSFMDTFVIHVLYFATGLAQLALVVALLGVIPRIVPPAVGASSRVYANR